MRWAIALVCLAACQIVSKPDTPNGEACDSGGDCKSGTCQGNVCNWGDCRPDDGTCTGDFACVFHDGGFLGHDYYRCEMLCGANDACPDWFYCSGGMYCAYTGLDITYTPATPVANQPVTFTGHFFEDKPRRAADWLFETSSGVPMVDGETATMTFEYPGQVTAVFTAAFEGEGTAYQTQLKLTIQ
jgi:hypothetical protein